MCPMCFVCVVFVCVSTGDHSVSQHVRMYLLCVCMCIVCAYDHPVSQHSNVTCTYVCVYVCMYVCVCDGARRRARVRLCMCARAHVRVYIYINRYHVNRPSGGSGSASLTYSKPVAPLDMNRASIEAGVDEGTYV